MMARYIYKIFFSLTLLLLISAALFLYLNTHKKGSVKLFFYDKKDLHIVLVDKSGLIIHSDNDKVLQALNMLHNSHDDNLYSEVDSGIVFKKVEMVGNKLLIYSSYKDNSSTFGGFAEYAAIVQIIKTSIANNSKISKIKIIFENGVSPFNEINTTNFLSLEGDNLSIDD